MSEVDPNFMHEVANTPRGEGVLTCIQCGRCTSSCPVARFLVEHNPRRLMEMIILGFRPDVLRRLPWYCLSCFTCLDRCPQRGDVGEVVFAIRSLAAREGDIPEGVVEQAKNLLDTGRLVPTTEFMLRQRKTLGLPEISMSAKDAETIMKRAGVDKMITKARTKRSEVRK